MTRAQKRNRRKVHAYRIAQRVQRVQQQRIEFMLNYAKLDVLSIVALRKRSRGIISGGYNMRKPELIEALIKAGVTT